MSEKTKREKVAAKLKAMFLESDTTTQEVEETTTEEVVETVEASEEVVAETTEEVEKTFVDVATADGETLSIEPEVEMGAAVAIVTEEGPMAAEDKWYDLADGRRIRVEGGMIAELEEAAEEAAPEEEEEMSVETEVATPAQPKVITESVVTETKFEEQANKIDTLTEELKATNERVAQLLEVVTLMAEVPSEEPTKKVKKNPFRKEKKVDITDKLSKYNNNKKQ